jgi:NADPH:quinone reductase-like Zn-dependent oxidoreductase
MGIGVRQGMTWTETPDPRILGVEGVGRVVAVGGPALVAAFAGVASETLVRQGDKATEGHALARLGKQD